MIRIRKMLVVRIILVCIILARLIGISESKIDEHPNMYVNGGEIRQIKERVYLEPWKSAYNDTMNSSNRSLRTSIQSVVFKGNMPPSGDIHDYYTDELYTVDGTINKSADRYDFSAVQNMSISVRSQGIAYALTGNVTYADKAVRLINAWTVNPSTRMNTNFTNRQSKIDLATTLPGLFYGADLIWNYPGWNKSDKSAFKNWTAELVRNTTIWNSTNNFENWRLVLISSGSVIAEDNDSLQYAFNRWKEIIPDQMNGNGSFKYELARNDSLIYSTLTLNAMIQTAEIARHHNVDLYGFRLGDGRGLEKSLDYHAPYVVNSSGWKFRQGSTYKGDNAAIYELGYAYKKKTDYKNVIKKWGRPMFDTKFGPATLTHGKDIIPPDSVSNLKNTSYVRDYIRLTWKDPNDPDFSYVKIYINGIFKTNVLKGRMYYNASGLKANTDYKISTRTYDIFGNGNATLVSRVVKTRK